MEYLKTAWDFYLAIKDSVKEKTFDKQAFGQLLGDIAADLESEAVGLQAANSPWAGLIGAGGAFLGEIGAMLAQ
jgi:hypothetical protein